MEYPSSQVPPRTYTLDTAPANSAEATEAAKKATLSGEHPQKKKKGMNLWLILLILFIVIGVILYFSHPSFVLSRNPQTNELYIDWGKLILWALGIAIIIVLLLWVLKGVIGYEMSY